jgi:hypothetical protein
MMIIKHDLSDEERSKNRLALIKHLKERKQVAIDEIKADAQDPFFLSKLEELRMKKNLMTAK